MITNTYQSSFVIQGIPFTALTSHRGLKKIFIGNYDKLISNDAIKLQQDDPYMLGVYNQVKEYFNRERKEFDIPLDIEGTEFQIKVWDELIKIPYGVTISYKQLAERTGDVYAVRAVGKANGSNPIPVIIPCHRVIEANGKLGGYSAGINIKDRLLKLEGSLSLELFEVA
ncbi:MAG: methylated-DNA--[protein]-cysteine S-methyltransferase [Ignavibacteriales bacterium]|nr:MAG: methylated-DNA--[protein]-cysteine S-methyltransferase [Ignavibacteriales bacterium]